ncbi:MAG: succinate dehydrogenase assembly factor 2 [Beijerinckiaceae bacterium]
MSGSQITSAGLDARRRRALFRSWHRGMREMDLIMGRFADAEMGRLSEAELEAFEALLERPDHDVFSWLTGEVETPAAHDTPVFRKLKLSHTHEGPIDL